MPSSSTTSASTTSSSSAEPPFEEPSSPLACVSDWAAASRGRASVAADVVPVLDDLERAIEAAGLDPEGDSDDGLAHGVILVFRGLRETLKRNGIEAVDPKGEKFDPTEQEALSTMPVEGVESGTVVEVMQKGYRMDGQLIRPARVVVSA